LGATAGVPNSLVLQNDAWSSIGSGIYNGLTTSLSKRFSRGLQFKISYTFSRALDNTSDYSTLSVPFRPDELRQDRSLSNFNVTHNFVASAVYTLRKGIGRGLLIKGLSDITFAPLVFARSGVPFTLIVPGLGGIRGNGTLGHNSEARPWYEPRNIGVGPTYLSWDLRIAKAFSVQRDKRFRFIVIAQAQNLLNRVNFAAVNGILPADPNLVLPNGGTLVNGPYAGIRGIRPLSRAQIGSPFMFTAAYPPRYLSFGVRMEF
jgi:hypothetical protein